MEQHEVRQELELVITGTDSVFGNEFKHGKSQDLCPEFQRHLRQ